MDYHEKGNYWFMTVNINNGSVWSKIKLKHFTVDFFFQNEF